MSVEAAPLASGSDAFSVRIQRLFVWGGPIGVVIYLILFVMLGHFLPPPSPLWSADRIAAFFSSNSMGIQVAMIGGMATATMFLPVYAIIGNEVRRAVPRLPLLGQLVFGGGVLLTFLFYLCAMLWATATFRTYDPETVRMLNDLSWLAFTMVFWYWPFMMGSIAIAALRDDRPDPVWPRWVAYVCLWSAVSGAGGTLTVIFKEGPLAWDGMLGIYIPVLTFLIWLGTMTYYLDRHLRRSGSMLT